MDESASSISPKADASISVTRGQAFLGKAAGVAVLIDGVDVGRIGSGGHKAFSVAPGHHSVSVAWARRAFRGKFGDYHEKSMTTIGVNARGGTTVHLQCKPDLKEGTVHLSHADLEAADGEPTAVKGPERQATSGLAEFVEEGLRSKEGEPLRDEPAHGTKGTKLGRRSLRFRLGDIAVSVHWSFLFVAWLGFGAFSGVEIAVWTLMVFFAILLHEFGHAFTARRFGAEPVAISLFAFGGATTWPTTSVMSPGQRFLATAAGSGVGILVGGSMALAARAGAFSGLGALPNVAVDSFIFASLIWGVLNWIPIRPLDGGQMTFTLLEIVTPKAAEGLSRGISLVTGAVAVFVAIRFEDYFAAFFVAFIVLVGLRAPVRPGTGGLEPRRPKTTTGEPAGLSSSNGIADEVQSEQLADDATHGASPADSDALPDYPLSDPHVERNPTRTAIWMAAALLGVFTVVGLVLVSFAGLTEDLVVGDCLDLPKTVEVSVIDTVSCDQPHENEVFALQSFGTELGLDYPSQFEAEAFAFSACQRAFPGYVGVAYQESMLDVTFLFPTSESWADGDRSIICILYRVDLQKMTGSMRGSGL